MKNKYWIEETDEYFYIVKDIKPISNKYFDTCGIRICTNNPTFHNSFFTRNLELLVDSKKTRPLEDWEIVKYKLLGTWNEKTTDSEEE